MRSWKGNLVLDLLTEDSQLRNENGRHANVEPTQIITGEQKQVYQGISFDQKLQNCWK